jgi:hypothetical protein
VIKKQQPIVVLSYFKVIRKQQPIAVLCIQYLVAELDREVKEKVIFPELSTISPGVTLGRVKNDINNNNSNNNNQNNNNSHHHKNNSNYNNKNNKIIK